MREPSPSETIKKPAAGAGFDWAVYGACLTIDTGDKMYDNFLPHDGCDQDRA